MPACPCCSLAPANLPRALTCAPAFSPRARALQWLKNLYTADDVKDQIYKLAKKGLTPSAIGVNLRDSHGIARRD